MLWELSVTEQRYRAVLEVGTGVPVTEVAERYGVSRQSVHTWLLRYRQEGIAGLEDRSHQVHAYPWRIPAEIEEAICELRRGHPKWGPRRLVFEMGRRGFGQVTRSTVYRTLVRNGLVEPKPRRRRRKDYRRWERGTPMELWQLDVTASAFLTDGTEVKIVTGVDDHSRFCVMTKAVRRATARPVCLAFVEAMRAYGVPEEVLTDYADPPVMPTKAQWPWSRVCQGRCGRHNQEVPVRGSRGIPGAGPGAGSVSACCRAGRSSRSLPASDACRREGRPACWSGIHAQGGLRGEVRVHVW